MIADNAIQTALPVDVPQTKRCTKCGEVKAIGEFNKNRSKKDGRSSNCKHCQKEYNFIHRKERNEYQKEYNIAHREEISIRKKARYNAHPEVEEAYRNSKPFEQWVKRSINGHKRCGYNVLLTNSELLDIVRNTTTCPICGTNLNWGRKENGHVVPESPSLDRLYNGKRISKDNSWIICHRCNAIKHDLPMPEFVAHCKMVADKFGGEYL